MRVAALYDIHGNLPALEAVLEDVRQAQVDRIVVGGDLVPGPMAREVLTSLLNLDTPVQFIHGNGELEALARMEGRETGNIPERFREAVDWVARQLQMDYEQTLASWPLTLQLEIPGLGEALFCHATPRDADAIFTPLTPEERLLPIFENLNVTMVVCGHTHMQFDRTVGQVRVVNAGSVGMPFSKPGAYWLLLGPTVEFRRTGYDLTAAAERIRQTKYPLAEEFAERYVLHPPSAQEVLELFSQHELK